MEIIRNIHTDYLQVFHCSLIHNRVKPERMELLSLILQSLGDWLATLGCILVMEHQVAIQVMRWRVFMAWEDVDG